MVYDYVLIKCESASKLVVSSQSRISYKSVWGIRTRCLSVREKLARLEPCVFVLYSYLWMSHLSDAVSVKVKVKVTLVQALRLCTGHTAHSGSKGIALLFHDHGTRRGWGVSVTLRPLFIPGKDLVPLVQEAGWALGLVWTRTENLASPGFDPRTVQPVASRYTDWANRPTMLRSTKREFLRLHRTALR